MRLVALLLGALCLGVILYGPGSRYFAERAYLKKANVYGGESIAHEANERFLKSIYSVPEYRTKAAGISEPLPLFLFNNGLVGKGLKRLRNRDLERYLDIRRVVWDRVSVRTCAMYMRGNFNPEKAIELAKSVEVLERRDIDDLFRLYTLAATAELRGIPDALSLSKREQEDAGALIYSMLRQEDRERFMGTVTKLNVASDEDACWLGRTVNAIAFQAQGDAKTLLLRSILE